MLFNGMSTMVVMPPAAACARGRVEALPIRAAWLIDVHVRIHETGYDDKIAGLDDFGEARVAHGIERADGGDDAVLDVKGSRTFAVRKDDAPAAHDQHQRSLRAFPAFVCCQNSARRLAATRRR